MLEDLESAVEAGESFGKDMLDAWKREEKQWIVDVLDISKHKQLKNPYEPAKSKGMLRKGI